MPRRILAGNWKMNKNLSEAKQFLRDFLEQTRQLRVSHASAPEIFIFPSFPHLFSLVNEVEGTGIVIGAQDCYFKTSGAFTGEVSVSQIKDAGASAVLVGHSERRHVLGEDNNLVAEKFKAAIQGGLTAFLCVGETREERLEGLSYSVVEDQLTLPLFNAVGVDGSNLAIAYEPVWAIGTGDNAEPVDVDAMADFIRSWLVAHLGSPGAEIPILYGGSVRVGNLKDYLKTGKVTGALVGGASLDPGTFAELYKEAL